MIRSSNGLTTGRACRVTLVCGLLLAAGVAQADKLRIENAKMTPRDATTVKSSLAAGGCCRSSEPGPTCLKPAPPPTG